MHTRRALLSEEIELHLKGLSEDLRRDYVSSGNISARVIRINNVTRKASQLVDLVHQAQTFFRVDYVNPDTYKMLAAVALVRCAVGRWSATKEFRIENELAIQDCIHLARETLRDCGDTLNNLVIVRRNKYAHPAVSYDHPDSAA